MPYSETPGHSVSTTDYASFILNAEMKDEVVSEPDFATSVYDSGAETSDAPRSPPAEVPTSYDALHRSHFKLSSLVHHP